MKLSVIYVKQLPNGLLYLGKTESKNPHKYLGSGTFWLSEIKKNNYTSSDIQTWILHKTTNKEELTTLGKYYSKLFDIVNSKDWANLKEEDGDGGNTVGNTFVVKKEGKTIHIPKEELSHYIQNGWQRIGHTKGLICINDGKKEKRVSNDNIEFYLKKNWVLGRIKKPIEKLKNRITINNGIIEKRVTKKDYENYDNNIWKLGRLESVVKSYTDKQRGKIIPKETKEKMKNVWTKEKKDAQSKKMLGELNPSKNKNVVERQVESRKKFYEKNPDVLKQMGEKHCKKIIQTDINGNFIKEWESIKSICKELDISRNTIAYAKRSGKIVNNSLWKNKIS